MLGGCGAHNGRKSLNILMFLASILLSSLFVSPDIQAQETRNVTPKKTEETTKTKDKPVLLAEKLPEMTVSLEGKPITAEVSRDKKGSVYVRAEPIFKALKDEFSYNVEKGALVVHRSQDGVVMELYTDTGIVKANGKALGKLSVYGQVSESAINLTPNAIAVLSGAIGHFGKDKTSIDFRLDPRLRVATGFEIFIEGVPLGHIEPGPKAVGSVMLLPLRPIAKALGHTVSLREGGAIVEVMRAQDSAEFTLNLETGLVKINDRPIGVTRDITYIDKTNLLLPLGTIESLTGTHIDVEPGSNRIEISLDDRLKGAIKPSISIDESAKNTPLTVETIELHVGTDQISTVTTDFRLKGINGRIRYETNDLPRSGAEIAPSWLSLDYALVKGGYGSIGDYAADLRELDGVGLRRIRGFSYTKQGQKGRWAVAAGVPATGSRQISKRQSRLSYSGLAGGVRYASRDGWEAGVSFKKDGLSDDKMAVLSAISGRLGRKGNKKINWDARADIGAFSGSQREKNLDVRVALNTRTRVSEAISIDAFASYDGAEFQRTVLADEARQAAQTPDTPTDPDFIPDTRKVGLDTLSIGAGAQMVARSNIGPMVRPAVAVRASLTKSGALSGKQSDKASKITNLGASFNTTLIKTNTSLSADVSSYRLRLADGTQKTGDEFTARVYQDTKYASARLRYTSTRREDEARDNRLDAQISAKPIRVPLPKDGRFSVAPSLAGSWGNTRNTISGGVVANLDSGDILGHKTKLTASLGVLQNFSGGEPDKKSDTFLTASIGRRLKLNKNMSLGLSYRNDLRGDQRLGIFLDGRFGFHEKRKFTQTKDGRGVLKGRVFFDKNRNGKHDEDEPGIGGVVVRIKNTRLALRTDSGGYFTIQNIKKGLQELQIDGRSLPLGYALAEGISTKATIREGFITDVPMPVVQRGQIRGFAFIDRNGDGKYEPSETRLEGARILLRELGEKNKTHEAWATSFGQFAFDDLPAAKYELTIKATNNAGSSPRQKPIIVDLAGSSDMMIKVSLAARPINKPESESHEANKDRASKVLASKDSVSDGDGRMTQTDAIPPPDIRKPEKYSGGPAP